MCCLYEIWPLIFFFFKYDHSTTHLRPNNIRKTWVCSNGKQGTSDILGQPLDQLVGDCIQSFVASPPTSPESIESRCKIASDTRQGECVSLPTFAGIRVGKLRCYYCGRTQGWCLEVCFQQCVLYCLTYKNRC